MPPSTTPRWIRIHLDSEENPVSFTRCYDEPREGCVDVPKDEDDPALTSDAYLEARGMLEAAGGKLTDFTVPIYIPPRKASTTWSSKPVTIVNLQLLDLDGRRSSVSESDILPDVHDHTTSKICAALESMDPVEFPEKSIKTSGYIKAQVEQKRGRQPHRQNFTVAILWYRPLDFYYYCYWIMTASIPPIHQDNLISTIVFGVHLDDHEFVKDLVDVLFRMVEKNGSSVIEPWPKLFPGKVRGMGIQQRRNDDILDVVVDAIAENASRDARNIIRGTHGHLFPPWLKCRFTS